VDLRDEAVRGGRGLSSRSCARALLVVACGLVPWRLGAQPVTIQHDDVGCLVAGKYPEIHACFEPSETVARARVFFRADGTEDWYYVDMTADDTCFIATLPRPKASVTGVDYYVEATDQAFVESRTREYVPRVVEDESDCEGPVAPYVGTASVVVGTLTGGAFPAGFVAGGLLGVSTGAAAIAGVAAGAVVVGGAVAVAGGSDAPEGGTGSTGRGSGPGVPTSLPSPTRPPEPPGPTSDPTPTPPPSPGEGPAGCQRGDDVDPALTILEPSANEEVGAIARIVAQATDPGPVSSGVYRVVMSAEEQGGPRRVAIAELTHAGPRYAVDWGVPECVGPSDNWYVDVVATDLCGRTTEGRVRVKRRMASCAVGASPEAATTLLWTTELTIPDGRTQVTANGSEAVFPGSGLGELRVTPRRGTNRVEGVLTGGRGDPGVWRFTLAVGAVRPGSLRVVAGDVVALGPATVAFGVHGQDGERVVFEFDVD